MPGGHGAVSHKPRKAPDVLVGEGIEVLPEEVLQHVISFLPLQQSVQTCMVAKRWCHLWKSVLALRVQSEGTKINRWGVKKLNKIVSHVLLLRDRTVPLKECVIELCAFRSYDEPQINLWIRHALLCKAQILKVHLTRDNNSFVVDIQLISRHLTRLELSNVVLNDCLLNFTRCPALEELLIDACYVEADMILSQSLKRLIINNSMFYRNQRTQISIPSLVSLQLTECWAKTPLLESMPLLETASIKLIECDDYCGKEVGGKCARVNDTCENCDTTGDISEESVLLNGLAEAKNLELIAEPRMYIFRRDLMWCPTFSKLKTLLLNEWCMTKDLGALICLLQNTPVLEKLTFQLSQASNISIKTEEIYNLEGTPFASKHIKIVEIKYTKIDTKVQQILSVLITNGVCVEQININIQQSIGSSEGIKSWNFSSPHQAFLALAELSIEKHDSACPSSASAPEMAPGAD